jgi:3-oxoacyl-[acyl-carrier protein] reductase
VFVAADVGVEEAVVEAVQRIAGESKGIDVLVNSAAVLHDQTLVSKLGRNLKKHSLADWDETIRSNLTGTFLMAREVAAHMVEARRHGLIVNVSSISRAGNPGQTAYSASKGGIDAITVTWSQELAIYGIRVTAIAPGFVETAMTRRIPPLFLDRIRERTPLKRFGTLDEFGQAIVFVVENDYLNGKVLELDGGLRF